MFTSWKMVEKILASIVIACLFTLTATAEELPIRLQVALMSKIVAMEKTLAKKDGISIYVLGSPKIYRLLKQDVGFTIGNGILKQVDYGEEVPNQKYDVIYIGNSSAEMEAIDYATKQGSMSIYPMISGMKQNGSLGLGISSGKPKFLINLSQSEAEKLYWNAKILKVAQLK